MCKTLPSSIHWLHVDAYIDLYESLGRDPTIGGIDIVVASTESNFWHQNAWENGFDDLAAMYLHMLETYKAGYQTILKHIRDFPDRPFLLHCTGMVQPKTMSFLHHATKLMTGSRQRQNRSRRCSNIGTFWLGFVLHKPRVCLDSRWSRACAGASYCEA